MYYADMICLASGLLQFGAVVYALRLNRLFGSARLRWALVGVLVLLAFFYLSLPLNLMQGTIPLGVGLNLLYALISILLLIGMVHVESRYKERLRTQNAQQRALSEWESNVEKEWAQIVSRCTELTKANDELQQKATRLQAEIAERNATEEQTGKTCSEYQTQLAELIKANEESQKVTAALRAEVSERTAMQAQTEETCRKLQAQVAELTKANAGLRPVAAGLESEPAKIKSLLEQARQASPEGQAQVTEPAKANGKSRRTAAKVSRPKLAASNGHRAKREKTETVS
jgi:chromosome segregation ATPase